MSDHPFAEALAALGPEEHGLIRIHAEKTANGEAVAVAEVMVHIGKGFWAGASAEWHQGAKPDLEFDVIYRF